jgi:leucyl aminopeptidase
VACAAGALSGPDSLVTSLVVHVEATTDPPFATNADTIVVGHFEDGEAASRVPDGLFSELVESGEVSGKLGHAAVVHADGRRLIIAGLGPGERFGAEPARVAAAAAHSRAQELSASALCWELPPGEGVVAGVVEGTLLHAYTFDRYQAPGRAEGDRMQTLLVSAAQDVGAQAGRAAIVAAAQNRARDLGNTPSNDLTPSALAQYAQDLASRHPALEATVMDEQAIREAGMGAFAAVAKGSAQDAQLIRLDYTPEEARGAHLGIVGKAVTFDSGGLALKSREGMDEMKFDMCGGAAVIEAIGALAELGAPSRVTGFVGATENLPSGRAVKPGDIVRALDGTTIEVRNPDAEGRLVMADCLVYARRHGCERLVDIATLTGGVVTALGSVYAGLMANDPPWAALVRDCGERTGDRVWELPLDEYYAEMVKGRYAQLSNLSERREAQPITAAELLHHFAADVPWAHLDIAGTAWDVPRPYFGGKGATGFGVRLLVELAQSAAG